MEEMKGTTALKTKKINNSSGGEGRRRILRGKD